MNKRSGSEILTGIPNWRKQPKTDNNSSCHLICGSFTWASMANNAGPSATSKMWSIRWGRYYAYLRLPRARESVKNLYYWNSPQGKAICWITLETSCNKPELFLVPWVSCSPLALDPKLLQHICSWDILLRLGMDCSLMAIWLSVDLKQEKICHQNADNAARGKFPSPPRSRNVTRFGLPYLQMYKVPVVCNEV